MNFYTCKHSSQFRIETCIEVIDTQLRPFDRVSTGSTYQLRAADLALTGVQAVGEHVAGGQARFTEGIITHFSYDISAGIGRRVRRAEAVFEDVVHVPIDAHRAPGRIVGDRARHGAARAFINFVDIANVNGATSIRLDLLDEISITIIHELRGLPAHSH